MIYKYNADGSTNTAYELKKIYLVMVVALTSIYYFNVNPAFNNKLNMMLDSIGLNIYFVVAGFLGVGMIVFSIAKKHEKIRTRKKVIIGTKC